MQNVLRNTPSTKKSSRGQNRNWKWFKQPFWIWIILHGVKKSIWWRWVLISLDGVVPSRTMCIPLLIFPCTINSRGFFWHWLTRVVPVKGRKTFVCVCVRKVKYTSICIALYHDLSLKRSGMARVNERSHSFTCHPHVYPQVE